jgi:hypothetical protein
MLLRTLSIAALLLATACTLKNPSLPEAPEGIANPVTPMGGAPKDVRWGGCGGAHCLLLSGNTNCCANRCSGYVNFGPIPPSPVPAGTPVTFGLTPHSFNIAGDAYNQEPSPSGMRIDFGNGTGSGLLPLVNDQGQTAPATYVSPGRYHVQAIASEAHWFRSGDWECRYRCCRYENTFVDVK